MFGKTIGKMTLTMIRTTVFNPRWLRPCFITVMLCLGMMFVLNGCQTPPKGTDPPVTIMTPVAVPVSAVRSEPIVRVRIITSATSLQISSPTGRVLVRSADHDRDSGQTHPTPLIITGSPGRYTLGITGSSPLRLAARSLHIQAQTTTPGDMANDWLQVNGAAYPHGMTLQPATSGRDSFDVINALPMEEYLPGVLDKELFPKWHPETFRAQAIAARTYAIAELGRSASRPFDLEATVASQAYGGKVTNPRALAAARDTRGAVLTWNNQVFPAYYSSCCGGAGQDAVAAFPQAGAAVNIPPLQGRLRGAWCAGSGNYRWGPVSVERSVLAQRLAGWGRVNRHPIANLQGIADIQISRVNAAERPGGFVVVDQQGRSYALGPEQFRFACNHHAGGMKASAAQQLVKSSHLQVQFTDNLITFSGQGLGHGVGLCQWGAQGLAQSGYFHTAILDFYYPGATIVKAYP